LHAVIHPLGADEFAFVNRKWFCLKNNKVGFANKGAE
jgi:hypothetical protein